MPEGPGHRRYESLTRVQVYPLVRHRFVSLLDPMTRLDRKRRILLSFGLFALIVPLGCAIRRAPVHAGQPPCRPEITDLTWVLRDAADERTALDAFCWAVGPPVLRTTPAPLGPVDSLAILSWNAHVGDGDLPSLVRNLRSGEITGEPVTNFVILLQEVHRADPGVPASIPTWSATGRRSGAFDRARADVLDVAREESLNLLYAPSMRNGRPDDAFPHEDRGNAILTTLPIANAVLLELPYERQRRVVVVAEVGGHTSTGEPWTLRFASVHFDNRSHMSRVLRSFGAGRTHQARALVDALDTSHVPTVVGGDLNTWNSGTGAGAVEVMQEAFPLPAEIADQPTMPLPWPLPDLQLDHLFFRLPDGWTADYNVLENTFGSDHYALLGWVRIPVRN